MIALSLKNLPRSLTEQDMHRALLEAFRVARRTPTGGVSVTCITDTQMTKLNQTYRHKAKSTDVLSFHPAEGLPQRGEKEWGDIFISPTYVRGEAKRRGIPFTEEMLRVTVHGMLHLMGYDHATEVDETHMFGLQERALARAIGDL